ncbi:uncharacterized protein BO66DRAFT_26476 [Aspergillus aculeatinus CBS 121060]|uniref:Uncharacterized protein n=1 Tax=Aspergillus aculeatinus CBS 121060 TaxID=1448322 RepID=A0ACD1HG09_9EURO|nr:hypothetical protein BO66DRAFT_26476 [Aspergillus aculeatinus CBS 121060]RAH72591.1 hypothetical protein BO66DRAFT_26476 [Aspergillus aculeatinus CBS 121060]
MNAIKNRGDAQHSFPTHPILRTLPPTTLPTLPISIPLSSLPILSCCYYYQLTNSTSGSSSSQSTSSGSPIAIPPSLSFSPSSSLFSRLLLFPLFDFP